MTSRKKKTLLGSIVVIVVIVIGVFFFSRNTTPTYQTETATENDFVLDVSVTGRVKPVSDVSLGFEKPGRVAGVYAHVGDHVSVGQQLVVLDSSELSASLHQAEASLEKAKAGLDKLKAGARAEEVAVQETKVQNAQVAIGTTKQDVVNSIQSAYSKSDDAIRNNVDRLFNNPKSSDPKFKYTINDYQLKVDVEWRKFTVEKMLNSWSTSIASEIGNDDPKPLIALSEKNLAMIRDFLDKVALATNDLTANASLSQTTIDGYKSSVSSARASIDAVVVNLSTVEGKYLSAESSLSLAIDQLSLTKASATAEDIAAQEAQVVSAEATVENIQAQIAKTVLRSPMSGVVTEQNAKDGQIVSVGSPIVTIISDKKFKVEANIPEVDIVDVTQGDHANITLDAYNDIIFGARVVSVDPAETILQGVPTYKTTLYFDKSDDRIKPGMTANIDIIVDKFQGVLSVPVRAVNPGDAGKTVRLLQDGVVKTVPVETGRINSDGRIEIVQGIKAGDEVITTPLEQ